MRTILREPHIYIAYLARRPLCRPFLRKRDPLALGGEIHT